MERYIIVEKESGRELESFPSLREAEHTLGLYERDDKVQGCYSDDSYTIKKDNAIYVTVDNTERKVDKVLVSHLVNDELYNYSRADRYTIINCILFLIDGLECDSSLMNGTEPERYYFDAVVSFLNDGHTVFELDHLEDEADVFDYCN